MSDARYDAVVIGGGVGGITAAAYLARSGLAVLLVEASDRLGGENDTVEFVKGFRGPLGAVTTFALDPRAIRDLGLHRRGLRYAERDMALVGLRAGGRHLTLPHDLFAARAAIAEFTRLDAKAWRQFRRETFALARRLRPLWTGEVSFAPSGAAVADAARALRLPSAETEALDLLARSSAAAYLDRWFESDALKATLAFDVAVSDVSPQEAGSALVLLWRYAQESCGLQGAVSQVAGGPGALVNVLADAAQAGGATLRLETAVDALVVENGRVAGVVLGNGEEIRAPVVVSSLSRQTTLFGLAPPSALPVGAAATGPAVPHSRATLLVALSGLPPFAGLDARALHGRLAVAERPESAAEAKGAALRNEMPNELVVEAVVPSVADAQLAPAGAHVLAARVHYLPVSPDPPWEAWRPALIKRLITTLEAYAPGLKERVEAEYLATPDDFARRLGEDGRLGFVPERVLYPYRARLATPIAGLYLCGNDAEPVPVLSGRAGRIAAALIVAERTRGCQEPAR